MSDEFDDDYNDFIERFKRFLNIDSDNFDVDFLFLPEPNFDPNNNWADENVNGFKVTYHFESGMDKPEIRIEGNFDQKKLEDYFKRFNVSNFPQFKQLGQSRKKQTIDLGPLSLQPNIKRGISVARDLYHELNAYEDFVDILVEAPGVEKGHILLSLREDGRELKISIEINFINSEKVIKLPYVCTMDKHKLTVNNGIISVIMKKKII